MKKIKNNALKSIFLILVIVVTITFESMAENWPVPEVPILSEAAILIDADSGTMLYGKNQDAKYYPASITKVMTAIVVMENVKDINEKLTFSYDACNTNLEENATVIGALPGDRLSVKDCLYSLLLHSANDCANALAEFTAGSNDKFAEMMNEKAKELGCTNTHFCNPSGLQNKEHYTSCSDMAKIMQYAISIPLFCKIDKSQVYKHGPIKRYPDPDANENTIYAHHKMMRKNSPDYYPGVFAGKTGYTIVAGNTLLTACKKDDMTLIAVILNAHQTQYKDSKVLFDFGFNKFHSYQINEYEEKYKSLKNNYTVCGIPIDDNININIDSSYHIILPKNVSFNSVKYDFSYDISEKEKSLGSFAKISYSYENRNVGSAYLSLYKNSDNSEEISEELLKFRKTKEELSNKNADLSSKDTRDSNLKKSENNKPIYIDKSKNKIVVQTPIIKVCKILSYIAILFIILAIFYLIINSFLKKRKAIKEQRRKRQEIIDKIKKSSSKRGENNKLK